MIVSLLHDWCPMIWVIISRTYHIAYLEDIFLSPNDASVKNCLAIW